jgi:2,3-bisphosphoglycerate-independent phosphoglycerate mutase
LVNGTGKTAHSAEECISSNYTSQIFDEMIEPTVILREDGQPVAKIGDNDAVVFVNFRSDRAIQLTEAFVMPPPLPDNAKLKTLQNLYFVTMTEYKPGLPVHVAFKSVNLKNYLSEILAQAKLTQFHVAESEKYAHVTAFFNCGRTEKAPGEEWTIVTSPENGRNYMDHPEMSAGKLTDALVEKITKSETNFFVANYANPDMVGHTGSLAATIEAVSFIDGCMKRVAEAALAADAVMIVTADHGNAEQMINTRTGDIDKDHTTNPVPFLLIANEFKFKRSSGGGFSSLSSKIPAGVVSDIAPTILELFGLAKPPEMTGVNLLESFDEIPVKN